MPTILGANTLSSGFDVANSCRFNDGDSAFLSKTQGTGTNTTKLTVSIWIKRGALGTEQQIFETWNDNNNRFDILFKSSSDQLEIQNTLSGSTTINLKTNRVFRDSGAWYHIVVIVDSTQGTAANRVKLYVNGVQETSFATETYLNQNADLALGTNSYTNFIGKYSSSGGNYFDGYMCEVVYLDGTAAAIGDLGEFDEDTPRTWKPIDVSGLTFGNNGAYLDFEDSSNLGNDANGGTDYGENNIEAIDQCTDTCTNNFATFTSENHTVGSFTLEEGNLKIRRTTGTSGLHGSSIMPTTGKWYFEVKIGEAGQGDRSRVGVMNYQKQLENSSYSGVINTPQQVLAGCTTSCKSGKHFEGDGAGVMEEYTASGDYSDGDIVQVAMDLDNKAIYFGRNGTFLTRTGNSGGDPTSGASKTGAITTNTNIMDGSPMTAYTGLSVGSGSDTSEMFFNFGNPPFSISSGNADDNGYGNFEHDVPTGYLAWCTKNLGESG